MKQTRCINCMELIDGGAASCPYCGYEQNAEFSVFGMKPGTILKGRYLVGRILGQGGFGITYVGYDLILDVKVAVKEYFPMGCATRNHTISNQIQWNTTQFSREQWQQGSESFLKEARRLAKLDSLPGIVRVKDTFSENQTSYIIMEYIEGETLKDRLKRTGTMSAWECTELLTPLMESLAKMHQKGLVHRDISPDNIMIMPDGGACLLDFGAAKDMSYQQTVASSQQVAKKGFSPPEQYREKGKIGSWTDVYALCATIYYCVTGKLVPDAMDRLSGDTLDNAGLKGSMGEAGAAALSDGLKLQTEERIQTVEELLERLKGENDASVVSPLPAPVEVKKSRKKLAIAAVSACAVLFVVVVAILFGSGDAEDTAKNDDASSVSDETQNLFANTLMADAADDAVNDIFYGTVLGSNISRDDIVSVTFTDTLKEASDTAWDVSWDQDGTVMAWTEQNAGNEQYYDLFVGAEGGVKAKDCYRLFAGYYNVETISFQNCFDTSEVMNMESMFYDCKKLKELDAECLNTGKTMKIRWMFYNCESLAKLDVSGFDTGEAENMKSMFCGCKNLEELDVSGFDTSKVTDMSYMFKNCENLTTLDVGNFDTSQVTNMEAMFECCFNLSELDTGNFDTGKVTDMSWMFNKCENLATLDVGNFDTNQATSMKCMFQSCSSLKDLDVSGFNISDGADVTDMFKDCALAEKEVGFSLNKNVLMKENAPQRTEDASLAEKYNINYNINAETVYLGTVLGSDISRDSIASVTFTDTLDGQPDSAWDVSMDKDGTVVAWVKKNVENEALYDLFIGAEGGVNGRDCSWLFSGYYNVETIKFNHCFNTGEVTDMKAMFLACANLKSVDVDSLNTSEASNMGGMFSQCRNLETLDLSGFDTDEVIDMQAMFNQCKNMTELNVGGFDTSKVTNMSYMFNECEKLAVLDIRNFDTSQVMNMRSMFQCCFNLKELDVSGFNTQKVTDMSRIFNECEKLASLDVRNFDTSQVTDIGWMFRNCFSLTEVDVSGFDTSTAENMKSMFSECEKLKKLDVSGFDTSQVTDMRYMFYKCTNLTELDVSNFTVVKDTKIEHMFDECGIAAEQAGLKVN